MSREIEDNLHNIQMNGREAETAEDKDFVDFTELPSLQHMAVVSAAILLWTQPDTKKAVKELSLQYTPTTNSDEAKRDFEKIVEVVFENMTRLFLPDSLKLEVSDVIRPIGLQLLKCFMRRKKYPSIYNGAGQEICWTAEGVIDEVKTLKNMIYSNGQEKDLVVLFKLANFYCLEECNADMWPKVKPLLRQMHYAISFDFIAWRREAKNTVPDTFLDMESFFKNKMEESIRVPNAFWFKYFFNKLAEKQEWDRNLLNTILFKVNDLHFVEQYQERDAYTDILCFLLQRWKNHQKDIFRTYPEEILKLFLRNWPFQRFFLPTITLMFEFLRIDVYVMIMTCVMEEMRKERSKHQLFRTIWLLSPQRLKNWYIMNISEMTQIIWQWLLVDAFDTIDAIFNDLTPKKKQEVVFRMTLEYNQHYLYDLVCANKLNSFLTLISKVTKSNKDDTQFKKIVVSSCERTLHHLLKIHKKPSSKRHF